MLRRSKSPLIAALAILIFPVALAQTNTRLLPANPPDAIPAYSAVPSTAGPVLSYEAGSTIKIQQLLGEEDKQLHQPTLSRTFTRYGIQGTDLGNSFENGGRVYFLFATPLVVWIARSTRLQPPMQPILSAACDWISLRPEAII